MRTNKIKNEIDKIKQWEDKSKQKDLKYETNKYICDFQQFETIRPFDDNTYTGKISIGKAEMNQSNLLENMVEFYNKTRPKAKKDKGKKKCFW